MWQLCVDFKYKMTIHLFTHLYLYHFVYQTMGPSVDTMYR